METGGAVTGTVREGGGLGMGRKPLRAMETGLARGGHLENMARSRRKGGNRETVGNGGKERWKRELPFTDSAARVGYRAERGWGTSPTAGPRGRSP